MSDLIKAIIQSRNTAAGILEKSLRNLDNNSEIEISKKILKEVSNHDELFPNGWYDPPPGGVCVLLGQTPFKRLQFKTLRNPSAWPNNTSKFSTETVGIIYLSPVDHLTGMFGDIGLTIYSGENKEIKDHIRKCYNVILEVAKKAEARMLFSDLFNEAISSFNNNLKIIEWMTTTNDPTLGINLGHTVPGSYENEVQASASFEELKIKLTKGRIYINGSENFKIPETCAFTVEARLVDNQKKYLPNVFFHFIVCFDHGKKTILENFSEIFKTVGMDYMN